MVASRASATNKASATTMEKDIEYTLKDSEVTRSVEMSGVFFVVWWLREPQPPRGPQRSDLINFSQKIAKDTDGH